jgi:hypothetical protein
LILNFITRLAAAWIALGAVAKLAARPVVSLPAVLAVLGLPAPVTYRVVLMVELTVAVVGLTRPRDGWALVASLLLAFCGILAIGVANGDPACVCLGALRWLGLPMMLLTDSILLCGVIAARLGSHRRAYRQVPQAIVLGLVLAVPFVVAVLAKGAVYGSR